MLTASVIIDRAAQIAKVPNYTAQARDLLNAILSDLCEDHDFAIAAGLFQFNFNPSLQSHFGSGPYNQPVDYLRAAGSLGESQKTFIWRLQGVPYRMVPCDLTEFDMQVQQAGLNSYPWLWATDLTNASLATSSRYKAAFSAGLTVSSTAAVVAAGLNIDGGDGIAGEGIVPGTMVAGYAGTALTLDTPAAATLGGASVFTGVPPQAYAYPPPSGGYPVSIRYQRMMPPIIDTTKYPWFPNDGYLIKELAARLMMLSDDSRQPQFDTEAAVMLSKFMSKKDDKQNRPSHVELDNRTFGPRFNQLPNSKRVGW